MLKQEPAVHEVVFARVLPPVDVARLEGDVDQAPPSGGRAGELQLGKVHVDADGRASGPGQRRHLERHIAAAASQIRASHAGPQPGEPEQLQRASTPGRGKHAQPLVTLAPAADRIPLHRLKS